MFTFGILPGARSRIAGLVGLLLAYGGVRGACATGVEFDRQFAPQQGLVSGYEEPLRREICLNGSWQFQGTADTSVPDAVTPDVGKWESVAIKIPSPWNVNSFSMNDGGPGGDFRSYPSYPQEWENVKAAWMQKMATVPKDWNGKRVFLRFGAVAGKLVVFVNGHRVGEGFDIFFPQEFDVTDYVHPGDGNQILVKVVSPRLFDQPGKYGHREYLAGSFWGSTIAGIWQDVFLEARPEVRVSDVFVQPWVDRDELVVEATLTNEGKEAVSLKVSGDVRQWVNLAGKSIMDAPEVSWKLAGKDSLTLPDQDVTLQAGESRTVTLTAKVNGRLDFWSPDHPNLYGVVLKLSEGGKAVDAKYQRFGWRQFSVKDGRLQLNGQPIVLHGDSWHFMGVPQMTRRYACAWYTLLKDAGANAVRLHASVYPLFYHDMADEMGIVILDESAIWASDGGPKADSDLFWTNCRTHVQELVLRDRNHPSVYGWSVCNEVLPVLRNVWHAPTSMVNHYFDELSAWVDICRTNDPTRPWISGDGEWDAEGRLPVINIHYGGDNEMRRAAKSGKPWAVGETGMAYYGNPKQVSKFNGNRAYESAEGRMEGLAYESYDLLRSQQKFGADYQSVFNIVWYSIQPLPLGKSDLTKSNSLEDGIFFKNYREGIPGMQPERLGPYVSTLNPGYDPSLPLYRPWPMFEAVRDANLGVTNSIWANRPAPEMPSSAPASPVTNATLGFVTGNGDRLNQEFRKAGIPSTPYSADTRTDILLVDGSDFAGDTLNSPVQNAIGRVLEQGGTVWVWDVEPLGTAGLSRMLGENISVEPRTASSFIVKQNDPLLAGLDNASLYFSEGDNWRQMSYGLSGGFVKDAQVVLEACPVEWRQWNYKGEPVKTAALYRSGVENTGSRAALVIRPMRNGRVILCNLSPEVNSAKKREIIARLFNNAGVSIQAVSAQNNFMDAQGRLTRALICGSFSFSDEKQAYGNLPPVGAISEGGMLDGRKWAVRDASSDGAFDFRDGLVEGPQENACAWMVVWVKSPKPLNDLLFEPNMPKLGFTYGSDDGCQLWLNGELLATQDREGPLEPEAFSQNPLSLKLGWNQLTIKVVQLTGAWKFAGKFICSDVTFLQKLEFSTTPPGTQ